MLIGRRKSKNADEDYNPMDGPYEYYVVYKEWDQTKKTSKFDRIQDARSMAYQILENKYLSKVHVRKTHKELSTHDYLAGEVTRSKSNGKWEYFWTVRKTDCWFLKKNGTLGKKLEWR